MAKLISIMMFYVQCTSVCPTGTFRQGNCSGNTSTDVVTCQPCQTCPIGQYISGSCTSGQTSECTACKASCSAGEYITKQCDGRGVTDLQCSECTTSCEWPHGKLQVSILKPSNVGFGSFFSPDPCLKLNSFAVQARVDPTLALPATVQRLLTHPSASSAGMRAPLAGIRV